MFICDPLYILGHYSIRREHDRQGADKRQVPGPGQPGQTGRMLHARQTPLASCHLFLPTDFSPKYIQKALQILKNT